MTLQKLLVLAAVFVSLPAAGQDASVAIKTELAARYAKMKAAMARKDEAAIRSLLTDGFVSVDVGGKSENASELIKEVLALHTDPSRQSQTSILAVKSDGRTAVVQQRYDMTKKVTAPDGHEESVALATLSTDSWVNDNGSWRMARTVTNQLDYSVDGITLAHKVKPKHN